MTPVSMINIHTGEIVQHVRTEDQCRILADHKGEESRWNFAYAFPWRVYDLDGKTDHPPAPADRSRLTLG